MHKTERAAQIHRLRLLIDEAYKEARKDRAYIALLHYQLVKLTH